MLYVKIAAALAFAGLITWLGQTLYQAGYDSAIADQSRAMQSKEKELSQEWQIVVAESESKRLEAIKQLNDIRNKPPEIITDVQIKTIERNVCNTWDRDFIGLLDGSST